MRTEPIIPEFKPHRGDDLPYRTIRYHDVPSGYRFDDLEWSCLVTIPEWIPVLKDFLNRYYDDWEINADTVQGFFRDLQLSLDMKGDNLRKALTVYEDDISLPILGRTITRTHEQKPGEHLETVIKGEQIDTQGTTTSKHYDLPVDNSGSIAYETARDEDTPGAVTQGARTDTRTVSERYTDTEDWSDVGIRPNYETLVGFWEQNPTAQDYVISVFKDNFIISEDWYRCRLISSL